MNRAIGIACLVVVLLLVLAQPFLAPYDPLSKDLDATLEPPGRDHPLGTDRIGRDVMARLVAGTWHSLFVALIALVLSSFVGLLVGTVAGLAGGITDRALSSVTDLLLAFPRFVILLNLAVIVSRPSALGLGLLIGAISWMGTSRMVRTEVLSLRERPFVEAALASGSGRLRIIALHLIPHLSRLVGDRAGLRFAGVVLLATTLDYLGLGISADRPTWGRIIRDGQEYLQAAPWITLSAVAVLCLTAVGWVLATEQARNLRRTASGRGSSR